MKPVFFESSGRWVARAQAMVVLLGLMVWMPFTALATPPYSWISSDYSSSFNFPPTIDATNFLNTGTWNIAPTVPYETSHTLNYTNRGTMNASVGWEFDYGPTGTGGRGWSANFLNDNSGTILASDGAQAVIAAYYATILSHVLVSATNLVNKGLINATANGEIVLSGGSVNLSHSAGLQIMPIVGTGSPGTSTNFIPDTAIYDEYWLATNGNLSVGGSPWDGTTLGGFTGGVSEPCGLSGVGIQIGPLTPDVVDSVTNALGPYLLTVTNIDKTTTSFLLYSNLFNQGVFVYMGPNNVSGQIRFLPTFSLSNGFDIVSIQLATVITNVVTTLAETNAVYIVDSFAASTNHGLAVNEALDPYALCNDPTFRPAAYDVSRTEPVEFANGFSPGLGVPSPIFFYDPSSFTNFFVTGGDAAAYSFLVNNIVAETPPGGSVTNLPGRVRIYANNLNLNQAHVRAEGQIVVQASNLVSSANAIMNCQNLSYNLRSTNGSLNFTNLALPVISRLHGTSDMVTAVWTNYIVTIFVNYAFSNLVTTTTTSSVPYELDITNLTLVNLSLTAVDASGLQTIVPVTVQDLVLHSTNIVVSDAVTVSQSLLLDGLSATLAGNVTLSGVLQNWNYANAPRLRYFTNNGVLAIPDSAHFGDDEPTNYLAFVNNGFIDAGGQSINSSNILINSGGVNFCHSSSFMGIANSVQLTGSIIQSVSDMQFFANVLLLNGSATLATGGALDLTVTNTLDDSAGSGNSIDCQNGFNLFRKPAKGDLLGTSINSRAPINLEIDHFWAGADRGVSTSGYVNNVAIGTLALIPEDDSVYPPLFAFFGETGANGLYVVNLDLTQLADYFNEVAIDPTITIYYKNVSLNPSVNTGSQTANQFLDGKRFLDANGNPGGYMHWVNTGPVASKPVNYGKMTGSYSGANGKFKLTVSSGAGLTNFVIQASADLKNWVPIYTNNGPFGFYTDPNAGSYSHRFYRTVPGH